MDDEQRTGIKLATVRQAVDSNSRYKRKPSCKKPKSVASDVVFVYHVTNQCYEHDNRKY